VAEGENENLKRTNGALPSEGHAPLEEFIQMVGEYPTGPTVVKTSAGQ
jgi:hypothetical protein